MPSDYKFFKNWNDLHLILMVARYGSFARAAEILGINQVTVAKRLSDLEATIGQRLFTRRRVGASPTAICQAILKNAMVVADSVESLEKKLGQAKEVLPCVTIGASEGLLSYTLMPALRKMPHISHPIDMRLLHMKTLPPLKFTTDLKAADVSLWLSTEGALPPIRGAYQVRCLGALKLRPFASGHLVAQGGFRCEKFEDLTKTTLFDMKFYGLLSSLEDWTGLCAEHSQVTLFDTTREIQAVLQREAGVTLFPDYALFYEPQIVPLDIVRPRTAISLWLSAHEDTLRDPQARVVYDALADAFGQSPWFQRKNWANSRTNRREYQREQI